MAFKDLYETAKKLEAEGKLGNRASAAEIRIDAIDRGVWAGSVTAEERESAYRASKTQENRWKRLQQYKTQQEKLKKLREQRNLALRSANSMIGLPSSPANNSVGISQQLLGLDKQISDLMADMQAYERGENGYTKKSEDDSYFSALESEKERVAMASADLGALGKEISGLESTLKEYQDLTRWVTDAKGEARLEDIRKKYGGEKELKELISQKTKYMNQARHIQESEKLSSVGDPTLDSYDLAFDELKKYASTEKENPEWWENPIGDTQYEWINNQNGFRDAYESGMERQVTSTGVTYISEYRQMNYDLLTQNEIDIYNYYYAKEGKEKAQEYLDSIQESLNYRRATNMFNQMEGHAAQEMIFGVEAGLDQFVSGVTNLMNDDDYIAQSAFQMASAMVREDLVGVGPRLPDWLGGGSLGQMGYDAVTTTANMAPSILTSMAVGVLNPVAGKITGAALLGGSAAGNAYQEALNEGYSKDQARGYAVLVGGSEIVMEKVLGGISALGGNTLGKVLTKNLNNADTALKMIGKKLGGSILSEFSEEYLQEVLTPVFENIALGTDNEVKLFSSEALYSGILGALTAGIMEGPGVVAGEVNTYAVGRDMQKADISAERLAKIGKTFSADTVAYQLAGKVNENTGAYTMGRLFYEIGATLTEQNVSEITQSLVEKGMPVETARANAEVVATVVEGRVLTERQMRTIEANDVLARAVYETIVEPNTTWSQRSGGFQSILNTMARSQNTSRTKQTAPGQETAPMSDKIVAENVRSSESHHKVSMEGKITYIPEDKPVRIKEIASIKDGKMMLELDDGRTVDAQDISYGSKDEALIYETVANMDVNASAANVLVNAYHPSSGVSAEDFAHGVKEAYRYGQYNYPVQEAAKGPFSSILTDYQRNTAYKLGKMFGGKQVAKEQAAVRTNKTTATIEKSSVVGKVHFDGDRSNLTERQSASLSALETVADVLGVQIHVFESQVDENGKRIGANGWYDPKDSSIHIDLHAGASGEATMMFTAAHELTHFIKQWSPAKFKTLANFLMKEYGQSGVSVEALVQAQIAKAERNGRTVTYDTAYEEVIADSMETMLADGNIMEKLAKLKQQDKSLWQKIKDFISELAAKIRKVYEGLTPDSAEGRYVADMKDAIEALQDLFTEALVEASENYQSSLTPGEEGVMVNQSGEPVARSTEDGTIQLSMRTYEEDGRNTLQDYLNKCVSSNRITMAESQEMLNGIEAIYQACKEFKDKYAPFSAWSDAAVVRDTYGKPVFSVVTPNGDYKMNLDFSLVCKKRRTLDAVFNEMSRRGIIDDFELGQKSVVKINEIIRKYGLETACALCFVDAKRFRQASMADQFTSLYNELVLSLVPEDLKGSIDHFNFSGYETIKKVDGGIHTWNTSKLDFSHLDEVMKNYGKGTVEHKAAKYIKSHPEGRKLLLRGDFMSSQGFDAVKAQNKDILKLYNSKKGTGGPKAAFGDVQYMNEIIKKARTWTPAKAYAVGGVRIQSFSDYVPRMVFDYVQMIYDLAATKLPAHAYTKEALFVKQFGLTGVKINMSLIPAIAEGGIAPGLDANGDYVWAGESFDYETAKEIQNAEGYTENCGTICVGVSYEHIKKLLRDPNIRMVIPYHKSGLNPIVAHMNKIAEFTDYTNDQRTKGKDGKALSKDFDFSKAMHDMGDKASPKAVADQYLKWCIANGYTAKFAEFAAEDNYYKLLEDFTLYDKDGNYVPQREVRAVFPNESSTFGSMKKLIKDGLEEDAVVEGKRDARLNSIVDEIQNTLPRTEAEISKEQVAQADRDLEAEVKYSFRGTNQDGIEVYETSDEIKNLPYKERQQRFLDIMANEYRGRTAKFIRNGHAYYAIFDEKDVNKNIYGDMRSDQKGWKAKINVGADGNIFELVENAQYDGSKQEKGKKIAAHRGVGYWDYFIKNVQIDGTVFDLVANVRKKANGAFVYSIQLNQNKKIKASPPRGLLSKASSGVPNASGDMVSQSDPAVKYSDRDTESVSNRSLLANAFESVAQNDIEKQKIQEYKGKIELINAEERKLTELNQKIKDLSFSKGPKNTKAIRELQIEAKQTANRISVYDKQLLRLEALKPLQDILTREKKAAYKRAEQKGKQALEVYRERAAKTQQEQLKRYQESRKKGIESREKTAMRHKIKNVVAELNQYLLKGDKEKRVMMPLQKAVAEALDAVNMDTVGAEERIAKLEAELVNAKTPEKIQEISRKIDRIREMGDNMSNRLKALKDAYREITDSDDPLIANAHDDVIEAKLESVIEKVGDTSLRDMNLEQLGEVYDMYRMVLTTIRNANKAFKAAKTETIATLGKRVMEEVEQIGGKKQYSTKGMDSIKKFGWNNLKPVYAFEHIGSKTFTEIFKNVRAGEDVWAKDVTEARAFYLDMTKKYKLDSWNMDKWYGFTSTSGMDFSLNLEQIMSLYAYSKREQAADHLRRGGIVIDESTEVTMKTKFGFKVKFNPTEATAYNISDETLSDIIGKLTPEQKQFVDEMQEYLSTVMGEKGNEVSLELYGVKLFKEKFYFPLKSASQFMAKAKEQQQGEVKIKNSGFSKETVKKASNPIVLTPFMNVWANHVNEMSMYHAFVLPMEDFYRVYNYRTPTSDSTATESVEMFIQNAYGKGATKYIDQLLKDLNGGARTDSTTGVINNLMGKFKKGAVFASASVVIQQPSAIARAAAMVDLKYFIGPKVDHKRHKALWDEVKQYAPVAIIKEMGYFDTNMGKSTEDFLLGKEHDGWIELAKNLDVKGFGKNLKDMVIDSDYRDEVLSWAPGYADEIAWCGIWEAVKRETKAKNPAMKANSEEFLKKAGERFTEVIVKTQVYDSVLSRSANMRSKDTGMKMATAFMAEPTTAINMVSDALLKAKRGDKKSCRKAIGAVLAAQILNAFLVSWVYAARDDDEDETYREKYLSSFVSSVKNGINPATYIPFIKDIVSIVQGYDVERSDMAVISDLWNAWEQLDSENVSAWRKVEGFVGSICQMFGLPVKNIMRDVRSLFQVYNTKVNGEKNTTRGTAYAIVEGLTGEKDSNPEQLYKARLKGDEEHAARVEARYDDEDSANAAVRKAITDRYMNGDLTLAQATMQLTQYAGMDVDEAYWLMDEWKYKRDTGSDEGYSKYNDLYEAVRTGKNLKDVIKVYTDNGVKVKTLSSQITERFKDEYVEMPASEKAGLKGYLINAYEQCGVSRENAEEKLRDWEFEAKYGFDYSDRKSAYLEGKISAQTLKTVLINEGGYSEEDAAYQIEAYEWEKAGVENVTTAAIRNYNEHCKSEGVPRDLYMKVRTFSNNTENDVDENGKKIAYSAMKKIMAEIDSLDLTNTQKDALARSMGWKESNIEKYKLWE